MLPEVNVTAPSPIVKRKPAVRVPARVARATSGTNRGPAHAGAAGAGTPRRNRACCLRDRPVRDRDRRAERGAAPHRRRHARRSPASKPGITGSSFAPGASSRPIIRGLDVNRVGIVENGTGGSGASDLGEDHFVPIDPLATNQVEVIRGPAALRYGSTSIGGVVSASNNRIPGSAPSARRRRSRPTACRSRRRWRTRRLRLA